MTNIHVKHTLTPSLTLLAIAAAVVVLSACGSSVSVGSPNRSSSSRSSTAERYLNTTKVARAIDQSVLAQRRLRAHAFCPSQVPQLEGQAFTCIAYASHLDPVAFAVVQVDGQGHVRYASR